MTRKAVVLTVLAIVGVVGLVGGLGWDERRRGEGELGWLAEKLVWGWGREAEPGIAFSDSVYVEGPAMSDWCKTAMTTTWTVSFDISFMSPEPGKFTERVESVMCICFLPGVEVRLANYGEVIEDEEGNKYNRFGYGAIVNSYGLEPAYDGGYTDYPADGGTYSLSGSVGIGTVLNKRTGDTPIGTKTNATHAKERWAEEGWGIPTGQMGYATIGDASVQAELETTVDPVWLSAGFYTGWHSQPLAGDLICWSNISFNGAHIDASEYPDQVANPSYPDGARKVGNGTTLRYYSPEEASLLDFDEEVTIYAPIEYSFSRLAVRALGTGALLDDLELWFSGAQEYDATDEAWHYLKKTLAAWRSANLRPNWGIYSWDTDPPPDGALRTLPTAQFAIDRDSAKAHYLEAAGSDA